MLNAGEAMYAYRFEGYWKDVGTIDSLWESNMDLLDPNVPLELNDSEWRIYSRTRLCPPIMWPRALPSRTPWRQRAAMFTAQWISPCCSRACT